MFDALDLDRASKVLARVLLGQPASPVELRAAGLDPAVIGAVRRNVNATPNDVDMACRLGVAWVEGVRAAKSIALWEPVATLGGGAMPPGTARLTGETLIAIITAATRRIRICAPFIDRSGLAFLAPAIAAASQRGALVELTTQSSTSEESVAPLRVALANLSRSSDFRLVRVRPDAAWPHLKVVTVDGIVAYVGSANLTAAALAGRNLELGLLVKGSGVAALDAVLDVLSKSA